MRLSPEDNARRLIMFAKGGIEVAGIDERLLVPSLAEVFRVLGELQDAAVYQCGARADGAPDAVAKWADEKLSAALAAVDRVVK